MLTFLEYVEKAKENKGLKNNYDIAKLMGINSTSITEFSKERSYPSQETVLRLATLAGVSPEQALIDFNLWKTKDKPNAHAVWQKMAKMIGCFLLVNILYCGNSKANVPSMEQKIILQNSHMVYIMNSK